MVKLLLALPQQMHHHYIIVTFFWRPEVVLKYYGTLYITISDFLPLEIFLYLTGHVVLLQALLFLAVLAKSHPWKHADLFIYS